MEARLFPRIMDLDPSHAGLRLTPLLRQRIRDWMASQSAAQLDGQRPTPLEAGPIEPAPQQGPAAPRGEEQA